MSKYNSSKTKTADGEVFDSAKEALRWSHLRLFEKIGRIQNLRRQVSFELIPAQWESYARYGKNGQRLKDGRRCVEKPVTYTADFVYEHDGETIVEDVKGMRLPDYVIKRKLMRYLKGIKILET